LKRSKRGLGTESGTAVQVKNNCSASNKNRK